MNYEGSNQWNIYNSKTKRIHLTRNVRFDEKNNYYKFDSASLECLKKKKENEIKKNEIWTKKENQQMNIFFRQSLRSSSRSSRFHYFTFINDDVEKKKKYIEIKENRQHVSSSIKKEIEKKTFIFSDKMTTSSISNNFRKFKKENNESSESFISSTTSKTINNVKSTSKTTSKHLYNLKSSSSKFNKQTRSNKKSKSRLNYKNLHNRDYLIKFKRKAHMYCVFKALFMSDHISFSNIKILNLSSSTKF